MNKNKESLVIKSVRTKGGKYRIDLCSSVLNGIQYFSIDSYTNGRSDGRCTGIKTLAEAERELQRKMTAAEVIDGHKFTDNPERVLIEKTRIVPLEERVVILERILNELQEVAGSLTATGRFMMAQQLEKEGYLPMMFEHAYRILLSRRA